MAKDKVQNEAGNGGESDNSQMNPAEMQRFMSTFFAMMRQGNGLQNGQDDQQQREMLGKLNERLLKKEPVTVAFPPCTDVLLSLIHPNETNDEINTFFNEYFTFCDHTILRDTSQIDQTLLACNNKWVAGIEASRCVPEDDLRIAANTSLFGWPPPWCLPRSCTTLLGSRHLYKDAVPTPTGKLRRLFVGDLAWLYYFERLGVFQIIGRILDEYAYAGKIPISNGVVTPGPRDDMVALVLEAMVRQTEAGTSSKVRDRESTFLRCTGYTTEAGKKLELKSQVNGGFTNLFNRFVYNALVYYKDRHLAVLIRDTANAARPTAATVVVIGDIIDLLRKSFDAFDYGRNYYNTLNGIVWAIASMSVIRDLRATLGIPPEYENPYEYIPAAYDLLVLNRPVTPSETNRYQVHKDIATAVRDILLDIEVVNPEETRVGGELNLWLDAIEDKVEAYRAAYRTLTGIDLAEAKQPAMEQHG
jgi:hypothetical protein